MLLEKEIKILVVICIILVAGLSVVTGMLIGNNSGVSNIQNNSTGNQSVQNVTNNSVNNVSKTKSDTNKNVNSQSSGIMSTDEAYSLMNNIIKKRNGPGYTLTPPALISQNMIYHSSAYYGETGIDENYRGFIQIDSTTGDIICYSVH